MMGNKENTQVAVAVMHKDSLMEESAPVLKMPEKVPLHSYWPGLVTGGGEGEHLWDRRRRNLVPTWNGDSDASQSIRKETRNIWCTMRHTLTEYSKPLATVQMNEHLAKGITGGIRCQRHIIQVC